MVDEKKSFVFVVCGIKEHTDTLAISLKALKSKTKHPILVVTDSTRNEDIINHDHIIDIETPKHFNHHQASIWLKTSLHKVLPHGHTYVYLDTDVIAIGDAVDNIFDEYIPPVRFASDHCKMPAFSLYAVNCGCIDEDILNARKAVQSYIQTEDPLSVSTDEKIVSRRKKLSALIETKKKSLLNFYIKYFLSWSKFNISEDFILNKRKKEWVNKDGELVMKHITMKEIALKTGLRWRFLKGELCLKDGRNIYKKECNHLQEIILKKWGLSIYNPHFQHWNGGVFIFSDQSHEFMDLWHQYTLEIFVDKEWKTRDQGTLIATVWKLGLEKQPTLDNKWNMILDYHNPHLQISDQGTITLDGTHWKNPAFVHIYHHWGDTNWGVWNQIMQRVQ